MKREKPIEWYLVDEWFCSYDPKFKMFAFAAKGTGRISVKAKTLLEALNKLFADLPETAIYSGYNFIQRLL